MSGPVAFGDPPPIGYGAPVTVEQLDTKARQLAIKTYYSGNGRGKFLNQDDVLDYEADYTVALWIKPEVWLNAYHHVFDVGQAWNPVARDTFNLYNDGGNRKCRAVRARGSSDGNNGATTINTGTWYHVALVGNSTNLRLFLNGVLEVTSTLTNVGANSNAMTLAHYMGDAPASDHEEFEGSYAAIKIWQAELTQAEIQQEMFSIRPLRSANLFSFYTEFLNSGLIPDMSGNGRHFKKFVINQPGQEPAEGPPVRWGSMVLAEAEDGGEAEVERTPFGLYVPRRPQFPVRQLAL